MSAIATLNAALTDRYHVERELGEGGMATVYLARDLRHDRHVALKVLKAELGAVLGGERFFSEIKVTANLQHPNLLPLFDSGEADGLLYYVMPYVAGETLRARLDRERQLPVDETVRLITLIANALDYAHAQRVIHRDLKPDNILLQAGQPVIADFGIALAVANAGGTRITQTGLSVGTPQYMSPEQATGDRVIDARSDQYSLGAVTYEMLTGEPPHSGPTAQAIIARVLTEKPRNVRATRDAVPVALDLTIQRALSKPPADRFPTCGDFARALDTGATSGTLVVANLVAPRRNARLIGAALSALAVVATVVWLAITGRQPTGGTGAEEARSIAVLPLLNVGGDSTQEYFADGMTEELANALGKVPGLRVAARTSAYAFKGRRDLDVREVGEKLGVAVVLQGSVRRAGNRLRVSVQLTDTQERVELWSQVYDREVKDVFAVQDSITQAIVGQLALQLGGSQLAAIQAGRTVNSEAHDLYLQGRVLAYELTESALRRAIGYYRQALAKDPEYPQAYGGIAAAYVAMADYFMPSVVAYDSVRMAALMALERDSLLADARAALGFASIALDWSFESGERELRRALEQDPNSGWTLIVYGWYLCATGRIDAGLILADRSIALDRLTPAAGWPRDACLYSGRRYDELIADHEAATAVSPNFWYWDVYAAAAYREAGRIPEALVEYRRIQQLAGEMPLFGYAITYARAGQVAEAREILGRLRAYAREHYVNPISIAMIYASLDEKDEAFASLDRAVEDRTAFLFGLVTSPEFDPLRQDPRFGQLIRRIGLPLSR